MHWRLLRSHTMLQFNKFMLLRMYVGRQLKASAAVAKLLRVTLVQFGQQHRCGQFCILHERFRQILHFCLCMLICNRWLF